MKKIIAGVFAFTALAFGAGSIAEAGGGKDCGGKGGKRGGKRVMKELIKSGAVTKAELAALKPAWKEVRACFKAVKAGSQPQGKPKFNHGLHFTLTFFTCGLWLPIWILLWMLH